MKPQDFWKESHRMCKTFENCRDCPLLGFPCADDCDSMIKDVTAEDFAKIYDIVSEWSDAHKPGTRQDKFLKKFPNAEINAASGKINIPPCHLDTEWKREYCGQYRSGECYKCAAKYWEEEANEDEF